MIIPFLAVLVVIILSAVATIHAYGCNHKDHH